jgi:meiotic recombination protein DMC1
MTLRKALEVDVARVTLESGSSTLDGLLHGGFRTGEVAEVFGASNTGKTQLALQVAVDAVTKGFSCALIDTEGQFRPERLSSISASRGVEASKVLAAVYVIRAENTRRQVEAIKKLREQKELANCKLVIVDTLTKNFTLEYAGAALTGKRQTALGAYLNMLARDAYARDRAVIALNRVASVGAAGFEKEVSIGGETVMRFSQKVLYLRRSGTFVMASRPDLRGGELRLNITDGGLV